MILLIILAAIAMKGYQVHRDVKQVMTYQSLVREVLDEQDTAANEELVLAMIYTETKGRNNDLMQSSELASEKKVDVWTAVQAYNFGQAYIDYVAQNGGENTLELAKKYSKEVVAPSLGNVTGKTYSYYNVLSIFYGPELYINGGNYYYSRQVRLNMYLIRFIGWL